MEQKYFEDFELVKILKKELIGFYSANAYFMMGCYYSFLAELRTCIEHGTKIFNKQILDNFNYCSDSIYQNDIKKIFKDYKIKIVDFKK